MCYDGIMSRRRRRRKRQNAIMETMNLVKTILLVVIAVAVVFFVVFYIKNSLGDGGNEMKASAFAALFGKEQETGTEKETETETGTETPEAVTEETEAEDGLSKDKEGNIIFISEGQPVTDSWVDYRNDLYYFDEIGIACTSELSFEAFNFRFGEDGALESITQNHSYMEPYTDYRADYPGLVQTSTMMIYLKDQNRFGRFRSIAYKKAAETMSHTLGGLDNPQFTNEGTIQLEGGYVYWLPFVSGPDEMESLINGNLYRMKPGDERRQIVAKGVSGYKALSDGSGKNVIYYCQNGQMIRCGDEACREDESSIIFTEDMEYKISVEKDRLMLRTVSGYPVTKRTDAFRVGEFTYALSETGEILSAEPSESAFTGDYRYSVLTEEAFGVKRSVILRTSSDGTEEIISTEFAGETQNIIYNPEDNYLYIEYVDPEDVPHIISSSLDGYVDLLKGGDRGAKSMKIMGFDGETVIVKETYPDGTVFYEKLDVMDLTGLALACDPIDLSSREPETEPETEAVLTGPGSETTAPAVYYGPGFGPPQGQVIMPDGPGIGPGMGAAP